MSRVRFAHISDLHLPYEPRLSPLQRLSKRQLSAWSWQRRKALHRQEILEALVADLRQHAVDHILITGDVVNFSLPGEFRQAAAWLRALGPSDRVSLVPGNHDALVAVAPDEGLARWSAWTRAGAGWPYVHRRGDIALIGLNSAVPTAPLLAQGRLGAEQLRRLERVLEEQGAAGRIRVLLLHHPVARGAVGWRKALADGAELRALLQRKGVELVLHGHARDARLDPVAGPQGPIPCLCVPSSSALPNPRDEGARWHLLELWRDEAGGPAQAGVRVRRWSVQDQAFRDDAQYRLCLPATRTQSASA